MSALRSLAKWCAWLLNNISEVVISENCLSWFVWLLMVSSEVEMMLMVFLITFSLVLTCAKTSNAVLKVLTAELILVFWI